MFNISHKDFSSLLTILDAIDKKIEKYTNNFETADEFYSYTQAFDASMMNFIVIGEMADKLSDDLKKLTKNNIDLHRIKSFRNIVAHNYFGIDAEEVWQIINGSLKVLKIEIKKVIE